MNGREFYNTLLPAEELQSALQSLHYPVKLKTDAGGYQCNRLFYRLMTYVYEERNKGHRLMAGFVHLPIKPDVTTISYKEWGEWGANAIQALVSTLISEYQKQP